MYSILVCTQQRNAYELVFILSKLIIGTLRFSLTKSMFDDFVEWEEILVLGPYACRLRYHPINVARAGISPNLDRDYGGSGQHHLKRFSYSFYSYPNARLQFELCALTLRSTRGLFPISSSDSVKNSCISSDSAITRIAQTRSMYCSSPLRRVSSCCSLNLYEDWRVFIQHSSPMHIHWKYLSA